MVADFCILRGVMALFAFAGLVGTALCSSPAFVTHA